MSDRAELLFLQSRIPASNRHGRGSVTLYVLFFCSGAAALSYEVSWSRQVGLILGNTAESAALVLASLFAGLSVGQILGGFLTTRLRPLIGYGIAELVAAMGAATVPLLLAMIRTEQGFLSNSSSTIQAVWCFAALLPTSIALGSTLPFIAAYFSENRERNRQLLFAYAINSLGGFFGLVVTTFFLLVAVGVQTSSYIAACVSALCGIVAFGIGARQQFASVKSQCVESLPEQRISPIWLVVAAISGFGILGLEVLYTRLFALVFHNSSYSFGLVIAMFLAGLSLGGILVTWLCARVSPRTIVTLSALIGSAAVAMSIVVFVRWTGLAYFSEGATFTDYLWNVFGLVAVVILPPTTIFGMALPATFLGAGGSGQTVGRLAAVNTAAAVAGAITAGFILLKWAGLWESFALLVAFFGLTAATILYTRGRLIQSFGAVLTTALLSVVASSAQAFVQPNADEVVVRRWNSAYGWIDVVRNTKNDSHTIRQNLHYRHGSTGRSAIREFRQGRLPLLLHPKPSDVAFLGLGTGMTVAPVVHDQDVKRATVIELIPEVVEGARLLSRDNLGVVDHPKVDIRVDDARHFLARTPRQFDVIVSDLFVPWESRSGYLYTVEFYQTARRRLRSGGLFCQWIALYQVGPGEFELIVDSFAAAFPNVTLWWGQLDSRFPILGLIGTEVPLEWEGKGLSNRLAEVGGIPDRVDPELSDPNDLTNWFIGTWSVRLGLPQNTDEYPRLEFLAPISHRSKRTLIGDQLMEYYDRVFAKLPGERSNANRERSWPDDETERRRSIQRGRLLGE